ncbi:MAG: hypothetical protein R3F59_09210 [Myxococcota bacterium]
MRTMTTALLALAAGCTGTGGEDFEAALRAIAPIPPEVGGCADITAHAADSTDTVGVTVQVAGGLVADALASGSEALGTFTLPDPDVTFRALQGADVTYNSCNDAPMAESIDHTGEAVSGTLAVTVVPGGDAGPEATLLFTDLEIETDTGWRFTLESLELRDVVVGWLPG